MPFKAVGVGAKQFQVSVIIQSEAFLSYTSGNPAAKTADLILIMLDATKSEEQRRLLTSNRDMKLRQYELSEEEWDVARQLRDVLKVRKLF